MTTLDEITTIASSVKETLAATDTKLDEIKAYIATLSLPQDKLDALGALLDSAKTSAAAVLAEADALDEVTPIEPVEPEAA